MIVAMGCPEALEARDAVVKTVGLTLADSDANRPVTLRIAT
jgi:hypothetical protein